jgi:hypothetical protein
VIRREALRAMRNAYFIFPVSVVEGVPGIYADAKAIVHDHQTLTNKPVLGVTPNLPNQGISPSNEFTNQISQIDYINIMEEAQSALNVVINNAQDEAAAIGRADLIEAIGRGIGNTAAHEVAHQFLLQCCDMDSSPSTATSSNPDPTVPDPNARGAYNASGYSGRADPSFWIGYWPIPKIDLHWENTPSPDGSPNSLRGLENCLRSGWYITPAICEIVPYQ